jgi:endonuclease YncB( thermonuclease family)
MIRFARLSRPRADAAPPWTGLVFAGGLACGVVVTAMLARQPLAVLHPPIETTRQYRAEVVRIIDGDTFVARLHVRPGVDVTSRVRLRSIDAPELHARCADELARARAATEALRALLDEREITIVSTGFDRYGRVLANVATRRTADVSAAMLANGMARPYDGGRRGSWCGFKWW